MNRCSFRAPPEQAFPGPGNSEGVEELGGGEGGIIPDKEFLLIAVGRCWNVLRFIALTRYARTLLILKPVKPAEIGPI